ncbi:amidohydrolase [Citrobacter amalonaticus]|uniref:Amidohydrolase n=1 Tax=Citrobacter amalonaticus TaxID=35703 RepID=A0A2S4RT86_CITAM|nr:amidohydrolase family protein [Citrobacter amalonaticus]POT56899.1 amidohydrolase [Citrobacter amalonaticus]POT71857.1 amidohydrolase [Citrobacter amalonaticus]POU62997.1 amidohydrolase [Citrobacter amalonaticus]POV04789.1 amidohydrolase [Citrobacter amalonaticus]
MRIIDTHNHIWHCHGEHFAWITDSLSSIRRDFLIEDLEVVLAENHVEGAILVQAIPTIAESEWLLEIAEGNDNIRGVIGWVDISQGAAIKSDLQRLQNKSRCLKGIRYMSQGLPDEHLLTPAFIEGVRCVGEQGLVYELLITSQQLEAARLLISACPEVTFVIEHAAKPAIRNGEIAEWREKLMQTAREHRNVYCKLSGLITEADYSRWTGPEQAYREIEPYIDAVFAAFGTERVMYGSDWPVSLLGLPYAEVLGLYQRYLQTHRTLSSDNFFYRVAKNVYSIK